MGYMVGVHGVAKSQPRRKRLSTHTHIKEHQKTNCSPILLSENSSIIIIFQIKPNPEKSDPVDFHKVLKPPSIYSLILYTDTNTH